MSLDIAYCYCTNLTEDQKFEIDKKVRKNLECLFGVKILRIRFKKEKVFIFLKNKVSCGKKKIVLPLVLFFTILTTAPNEARPMGVPTLVRRTDEIHRLCPAAQVKNQTPKTAPTISARVDKMHYRELPGLIYLMNDNFLHRPEISSRIREIRGGAWPTTLIGNTILVAVLYGIWLLTSGSDGFVQQPNPGWGLQHNLYQPPGLVRPADCETQLYAGSPTQSLKTEASRNQPTAKDRWILVESRPELVVRYGQAKYKVKDHGALTNLPYTIKKNGCTSTLRTEENVYTLMSGVEEVVENPNSIWFEESFYQGGTSREVEFINIFNEEENRVAIFKRSTGEFITFCEPDEDEIEDLVETGNFGGQSGWFSGQGKNVPPKAKVKAEQNVVDEIMSIESFESHVMGITPAPGYEFSSLDEEQYPGFTPLNSFESDVMGITPLDSSSSDYQI